MNTDIAMANPARSSRGFTLVETMIAVTILALVLMAVSTLMAFLVSANVTTSSVVASTNSIRARGEEVMAAARDQFVEVGSAGNAKAALNYYGAKFKDQKIRFGDATRPEYDRSSLETRSGVGQVLVHRFGVPEIGEDSRVLSGPESSGAPPSVTGQGTAVGDQKMSDRAVGEMVFYLEEEKVPPPPGAGYVWKDVRSDEFRVDEGFDLNRDGYIDEFNSLTGEPRQPVTEADLQNPGNLDIRQIPVDVTVTYYATPSLDKPLFTTTRRLIVLDDKDSSVYSSLNGG